MITICLCGDVMLFASALRSGRLIWWLLSVALIIISGSLASKINVFTSKKSSIEEIITQIKVTASSPESSEIQEIFPDLTPIDEPTEDLYNSTPIDELIELGFKQKYSDNFDRAAYFFFRALSLDPLPDLALYLIMDCYWLWTNLGERDYALTQLQPYIQKYLPQFDPEPRHQFEDWMTTENLHQA